jgi:CRP-like cAMP-binding protein
MHVERRDIVSILEVDPELGERLEPQAAALARRHVLARVERVERGRWEPANHHGDPAQNGAGLLVLEGLIMREIVLVGRETAELLGPGDVLKPYDSQEDFEALPVRAEWQVCEPASFAVLDHRFVSIAGRWPELLDSILARSSQRTRRLAVQLAVSRVTRVDERLLIILWKLAERWGRVSPQGVKLPITVTHETLARLVGARRPSVTTALGRLARLGMVDRVRGGWVLHGDAGEQLARLEAGVEAGVAESPV